MTWQNGTTDNYTTALQDLIDVSTGDHVATFAVNAGGTGYTVGDVLTIAGGTSTHIATCIVTAISGGVVTTIRTSDGGAYTVDPTLVANAVTGGTGSGCTIDITMSSTGWTVVSRVFRPVTVTITAGGTGHAVNDLLTVSGGTSTLSQVYEVTAVSGGVVTTIQPEVVGRYTVKPGNPASTTSDGSGTGCTLTIEYDEEVILQGVGSGAQEINVAIKTFQGLDTTTFKTTYNWAIFHLTDYNSGLEFFEQPGISPGFSTTPLGDPDLLAITGAYFPLRDTDGSFPIEYWFNITPSRIIPIMKVEGALTTVYPSTYVGYGNGFGTTTDLAFPAFVSGASHRKNVHFEDQTPYITGILELVGAAFNNGPGFLYRAATGQWAGVDNSHVSEAGTSRTTSTDSAVYPGGRPNLEEGAENNIVGDGWGAFWGAIPDTGVPGSPIFEVYPTEDSGGDLYWLVPAAVHDSDNSADIHFPYVELDDVFWVGRAGTLVSEDTITIGTEVYRIFQCGNRTNEWSYMAIKETY